MGHITGFKIFTKDGKREIFSAKKIEKIFCFILFCAGIGCGKDIYRREFMSILNGMIGTVLWAGTKIGEDHYMLGM